MRTATVNRETRETRIQLTLHLDGSGRTDIHNGVGFFDHMLTALAVHGGWDLTLGCQGTWRWTAITLLRISASCWEKPLPSALAIKRAFAGTAALPFPWTRRWRNAFWTSAAGPTWSLTLVLPTSGLEPWTAVWWRNFSGPLPQRRNYPPCQPALRRQRPPQGEATSRRLPMP